MFSEQESPEPALRGHKGSGTLIGVIVALGLIPAPGALWAALVINEFLPDPEGSDGGREFVELLNTGPVPEPLAGVSLQFANGAEGAVWVTRWSGDQESTLAAGQRFLIVDRNWLGSPPGQAEVYLGLQNGPDAVRLIRGESVLDLVGYGALTDPAMKEGDPADIATGRSLARRPDGRDTQDNQSDFVLSDPTPGVPNFLPFSLEAVAWELDPPSLDRASLPFRFTLEILNNGTETIPLGAILVRVGGVDHESLLDLLPTGQKRRLSWNLQLARRGLWPLEILVPLPVESDTLVLHPASVQVGCGPLVLNEVLSAPDQGQGEWVEIIAVGDSTVDLAGHAMRDEDGAWRPLPDLQLGPGEFLVLAQDSLALAAWHMDNHAHGAITDCPPTLALGHQRNLTGWPTLNNTPPPDRHFADRVYLANPAGGVIDHLTLEDGSGSGLSRERIALNDLNPGASNWAPCTAVTGSTPGCPNSVALDGTISTGFTIQPRILDPERGITSVHFLFTLVGEQSGWELRVYDLWGGLVRDLGGENLGPGPRNLLWDGRDDGGRFAGPGGYVALLEVRGRSLNCLVREKVLLVIR